MTHPAAKHYHVPHWAHGFFDVNQYGQLVVQGKSCKSTSIQEITTEAKLKGHRFPLLLQFPHILQESVQNLSAAFQTARDLHQYNSPYQLIYPIKVNQQREVIDSIIKTPGVEVGLEAGSKPELLAILSLGESELTILCNGYKDKAYFDLCLLAAKAGHHVTIIIEKPIELDALIAIKNWPDNLTLGIRVRLSQTAAGNWQNSGGQDGKFGLNAEQALETIKILKKHQLIHKVSLLHTHIGSQVANLTCFEKALKELSAYYREFLALGCPIKIIDVGGGLAVDYEGTQNTSSFSMAYDVANYAKTIVETIKSHTERHNLPEPTIFSESGRAITAHHAMLVTDIVHQEARWSHETSVSHFEDFIAGTKNLSEWVSENRKIDQEPIWQAIVNFSVFQSMPDVWGLKQVFPVLPINGLNEPLTEAMLIHDLTCDSDGKLVSYANGGALQEVLRVPANTTTLAFGLLGAYQDILGDMHNLFGNTESLWIDLTGEFPRTEVIHPGDTVQELLKIVGFNASETQKNLQEMLQKTGVTDGIEKSQQLLNATAYLE